MWFRSLVPVGVLCCLVSWSRPIQSKCLDGHFGEHCALQCRCLDNAKCDEVTGKCASGCLPGWSGSACQRKNMAYGLPASMRVSGNITVGNLTTDGDVKTCVSTRPNKTGWWKMDLQVTQRVYSMKIHTGNTTFRSWKVHVSDYEDLFTTLLCTTLRYDGTETYFTCDRPVKGRYVGMMNIGDSVTICEVAIFRCADFTYGVEDCSSPCRCSNRSEICDHVYGTCKSGCQEGWRGPNCDQGCNHTYGKNCIHRCGHCYHGNACDTITGACTEGCDPGWRGTTCHERCPSGTYGRNCNERCAHCSDGTTCSTENGHCLKGCTVGWKGPRCDIECDDGEFGENCAFVCQHCKNQTDCDRMTGTCPSGCSQGWEGLFCNQECLPRKFGDDCLLNCGKCLTQPCDRYNGSCGEAGCLEGWSGDLCDFACEAGFYGSNCDMTCGHCDNNAICDPLNGTCGTTCTPGYHGDKCILKCPDGKWGSNCSTTCGLCHQNKGCNHVTGLCDEGCFEGYTGTYCEIAEEFKDLSSAIVMPVMALSVSIVSFNLCLLFICLIFKWRRDEEVIPHGKKEPLLKVQPESTTVT